MSPRIWFTGRKRNVIRYAFLESLDPQQPAAIISLRLPMTASSLPEKNATKPNKTKDFNLRQANSVIYGLGKPCLAENYVEDPGAIAAAPILSARPGAESRCHMAAPLRSWWE